MTRTWVAALAVTFAVIVAAVVTVLVVSSSPDLDHTPSHPPAGFTPHPLSLGAQ